MGVVLAATFGLALWIVLWALGISGLDALFVALLVMLLAGAARIVIRHLPGQDTSGSQP
ncbi:MAG TPA: hypothetical protein VL977_02925 [Solirubrobacteraceae bacterium]|nr:hypothetical protein [Solirubrobacteraceae bacterium]